MIANPDILAFIDHLTGGPPTAPAGGGRVGGNALAEALAGIPARPKLGGGFSVPAIAARAMPDMQAQPYGDVMRHGGTQQVTPLDVHGGGGGGTGAGALTSGLNALGHGIQGGLEAIAAKQKADAQKAALGQGGGFPKFGGGIAPTPPVRPEAGAFTGAPSSIGAPGNAGKLYDTLIQSGATPQGAQGIVAGVMGESGRGVNPLLTNNSGSEKGGVINPRGSYGIGQWNGDRQADLKAFADQMGLDPSDIDAQRGFMAYEMQNNPRFAKTWKAATDPNASARDVLSTHVSNYEVPANISGAIAARAKFLGQAGQLGQLADMAQNSPRTPPATTPQSGGDIRQGIYNGQPYTYQTQPAAVAPVPVSPSDPIGNSLGLFNGGAPGIYSAPGLGPQGLNDQGISPLALNVRDLRRGIEPGSSPSYSPLHAEPPPAIQYQNLQNQPGGIQPSTPPDSLPLLPREYGMSLNPLALALAMGKMPQIDQNFGGRGFDLFG